MKFPKQALDSRRPTENGDREGKIPAAAAQLDADAGSHMACGEILKPDEMAV